MATSSDHTSVGPVDTGHTGQPTSLCRQVLRLKAVTGAAVNVTAVHLRAGRGEATSTEAVRRRWQPLFQARASAHLS